jgi:hypothetical protein
MEAIEAIEAIEVAGRASDRNGCVRIGVGHRMDDWQRTSGRTLLTVLSIGTADGVVVIGMKYLA